MTLQEELLTAFPHIFMETRIFDVHFFTCDYNSTDKIVYVSQLVFTAKYYFKFQYIQLLKYLENYLNEFYVWNYIVKDIKYKPF